MKALDALDLINDERFKEYYNRTANVVEAREVIQNLVGKLTREEAIQRFERHDVPCGPVRTVAEVREDQHFWDRGSLLPMRHGALSEPVDGIASGFPVIFSGGDLPEPYGAPTLGMHNVEIYEELLSIGGKELEDLKAKGVI